MTLAALYLRISEDPDGAGLGVARQEKDCRDLADRLDWTIVDVYSDNDTSAYAGKPREHYGRMLDDIRAGRVNAMLAWHPDRLHRSPRELEDFIDLIEAHRTAVQTVRAGEYDLSTPSGRAVARTLGAWARYESEHKADRLKAKHVELAASGAATGGGHRPYGYERIYDRDERPRRVIGQRIVPDEADVIRECARRVLAGEALVAVSRDLNRRGIATSTGGQWSTTSLARMLASARIAGAREHRPRSRAETRRVVTGEITRPDAWPAIVTPGESARLRALLTDPTRRTSPGPTGRHLLTGVLICVRCERRMLGRSRGNGKRMYLCDGLPGRPGCGRMYIAAEGTDATVAMWVAGAYASPDFRAALHADSGPDEAHLLDVVARAEHDLEELARDRRLMSRREWLAAREPIDAELTNARHQLARVDTRRVLDGVPGDAAGMEKWILNSRIEVSRRRALVLSALLQVTVHPAVKGRHRYDAARLDPQWRV